MPKLRKGLQIIDTTVDDTDRSKIYVLVFAVNLTLYQLFILSNNHSSERRQVMAGILSAICASVENRFLNYSTYRFTPDTDFVIACLVPGKIYQPHLQEVP